MNHSEHKFTNSLINESSPYLLQHAHNPVNWYPWQQEAFDKAQLENKLIIISIGYAACHWCHVMEHESFENEDVAAFMNSNFVCIKVDREERPDVDQVYMNAVQILTGSGGWPLNCVTLPDGRPIYGGTYFSKSNWLNMLSQVIDFTIQNPEKTELQAQHLTQGIQIQEFNLENTHDESFSIDELNLIFSNWKNQIDYIDGGHKRAPKFPLPVGYQFLLHYFYLTNNNDALNAVTITLDKMANGGIYDQIGGGFSRYSTDTSWKVPHFEKMLYDNAQLVSLYAAAYQLTKNSTYKQIVTETLEFIQRELSSEEGAFYASLDADSEGIEGKFYVWTATELQNCLVENAEMIIDYYNANYVGNWEDGQNILFKTISDNDFVKKYNISELELNEIISNSKKILLNERSKRTRPGLDDKILTSWNALMIKGYIDAYRVFNETKYLDIAIKNATFILTKIKTSENKLFRTYKNGKTTVNGFLDDYAFTIQAFIAIYQATFDEKWLFEANALAEYTILNFYDEKTTMFYYTSILDPALIARKYEISDNVIPSSNSEMAKNLFLLGHYFYKDDYIQMAKKMLNQIKSSAIANGTYFANWDILMAWFASEPYDIAIVGKDCHSKRNLFDNHFLPNVFLSGGKAEGQLEILRNRLIKDKTFIYVCRDKTCQLPVCEVNEALEQLNF